MATITAEAAAGGSATVLVYPIELFSDDLDFLVVNQMTAPTPAVTIPTIATHLLFDFGKATSARQAGTGIRWVPVSTLTGLTVVAAANAPTAANSLLIRDFPAAGTAGAATARDISIGHTATNQLMFASANISEDLLPLTIWYTYSAVVGSGGTGGAFDLHDDVTGSLTFAGMNAADRILLSDESGVGEPNVYTTTAIAASYFKSIAPWDLHDDVSITATIACR